ncbi:hypothetical protein H5410_026351 [Solanum commersonii]|uniref:Uncharacterized protein n=1 Tax=Solanum commersonii TaxID=4109 RepID=A0A9J5YVV2_SOLCO|nr:hypothetical protein H5410_026351 [Solanum commersonii]
MTEGFKRLNQTIERLETEKGKMTQHIHSLQERIKFLLENIDQTKTLKSSPSHTKMDKTGVHSPMNVERAIVPAKGTASPVQTVAEKTKEVIQEKIIQENPEPDPADSDHEDIESRSDENDLSLDQSNQHYDLNEDDDSGMSFDSVALHNLDT